MPGRYDFEWEASDSWNHGNDGVSWFYGLWEEVIYGDDDEEEVQPEPAPVDPVVKPKPPQPPKPVPVPPKPIQPLIPKADKEDLKKIVSVLSIGFHVKETTKKHRTDKYVRTRETKDDKGNVVPGALVVRRGDEFNLTLKLSREYDEKSDDLWIGFTNGDDPMENNGTLVEIPLAEKAWDYRRGPRGWSAKLTSKTKDSIDVNVQIPATCVVGEWKISVKTVTKETDKDGNEKKKTFTFSKKKASYVITILFNPWCKDDLVYMPETELLNEYVLNDSTSVYQGSARYNSAKAWTVGQFEEVCLKASLQILNEASAKIRSDPVLASRHIVKLVNSNGDNGVLVGNWSGDYEDGTSPSKWNGSQAILKQYVTEGEPVKYGQCWVFSMLTNTVCRSVGMPCRGITNFASAHDTDLSNTIDKMYYRNSDGDLEESGSSDSIWNFHVWDEVWMQRPDLDVMPGVTAGQYNGWQVIDATPQELSGGIFTCGPSPKAAIKNGECWIPYDTPFVFSEVNADVIHWEKIGYNTMKRFRLDAHTVGKNISTKYPDSRPYTVWTRKRLLVTDEYKYEEGTPEEAAAVKRAYKAAGEDAHKGAYEPVEDNKHQLVKVELLLPEQVIIGHELNIEVTLRNTGNERRTLNKAVLTLKAQTYTGHNGPTFFTKKLVDFKPEQFYDTKSFLVKVTAADYYKHLVEKANIVVEAYVELERVNRAEQEQTTLQQEQFRFSKPTLNVTCAERWDISAPVKFNLSFTNPLDMPLTNCFVTTESTVGFKNIDDVQQADVPALGEVSTTISIMPETVGTHNVVFSFECNQIIDIEGTANVEIFDPASENISDVISADPVAGNVTSAGTTAGN